MIEISWIIYWIVGVVLLADPAMIKTVIVGVIALAITAVLGLGALLWSRHIDDHSD